MEHATAPELPAPRYSAFWNRVLPVLYRCIQLLDPLIRSWWHGVGSGLDNVVELRVAGRKSGTYRRVLLTLLRDDGRWILGHPNGEVAWTLNLEAAGTADLVFRRRPPMPVRSRRLSGTERDRAIAATDQQPFPANVLYRLARPHIRAAGVYFELQRID